MHHSVKKDKEKELKKLESERNARQAIHASKLDKMKHKLVQQKSKISEERAKWQGKLDALNEELDKASDRVYREKSKGRKIMQDHIDKAKVSSAEMQNYIDDLEDYYNETKSKELNEALKAKRAAVRSTKKAKALADQRLQNGTTKE